MTPRRHGGHFFVGGKWSGCIHYFLPLTKYKNKYLQSYNNYIYFIKGIKTGYELNICCASWLINVHHTIVVYIQKLTYCVN